VKTWITTHDAALRCHVHPRIIAMAGVAGRLLKRRTGRTDKRPLYVYEVEALDAWIVEYRAERQIEPPKGTTPRTCLSCGETFDSEGRHNRICPLCAARSGRGKMRTEGDWVYADCDGGIG